MHVAKHDIVLSSYWGVRFVCSKACNGADNSISRHELPPSVTSCSSREQPPNKRKYTEQKTTNTHKTNKLAVDKKNAQNTQKL